MSIDRKTAPAAQKPASHSQASQASPAYPSPDRRLVKLLRQRESAQNEDKYDDADDRLVELIEECLLSGDNKALFDAVERAGRQGGRNLALALAESIEDCTASRIIQFDKKTRRGVRAEVADLSLHVLPIVTVSDHGLSAAKRLLPKDQKSTEMIRALENSFKNHGLAPKSAHIRVAPYLYHWDELNTLAYSEIHELGLTLMNEKDDDVACARKGWPPLPHIQDGKYIELRFLLVTTVTPMTEPHVPFIARFDEASGEEAPEALQEEAFEAFDRQRHAWTNAVAPLLAEWIGGEAINLTAPFSFFDGLRAGWIFHADSSLALGVEFAIKSQFLFPRECSVHLALHGDDNEAHLRVTLTHQQKLIHGLMRPIAAFEDREAVLQNAAECLKPLQLGALSVQGGVQPAFHCEGCKAPLFSTPWGDLLHPGEPEDFEDDEGEDGYGDDEGAFDEEDLEGHEGHEFSGAVTKQKDPAMLKVAAVLQGKTLH